VTVILLYDVFLAVGGDPCCCYYGRYMIPVVVTRAVVLVGGVPGVVRCYCVAPAVIVGAAERLRFFRYGWWCAG